MREASTAARVADGVSINVGYPSPAQSAVVSPTEALCVAQDHLEAVLAEYLSSMTEATVQRGVEVLEVRGGGSSEIAHLTVRDGGGWMRTIGAGIVVAADGARSAVRDSVGIGMTGPDDVMAGIQVEFRAPLWDVLGEHRHLLYSLTDPEGNGTLVACRPGRPVDLRVAGRLPLRGRRRAVARRDPPPDPGGFRVCRGSRCGSSAPGRSPPELSWPTPSAPVMSTLWATRPIG